MITGTYAIKAQDFTRKIKTGDLFNPVIIQQVGFDGTGAYRKNRGELIFTTLNVFSRLNRATTPDNVVDLVDILDIHSNWQA